MISDNSVAEFYHKGTAWFPTHICVGENSNRAVLNNGEGHLHLLDISLFILIVLTELFCHYFWTSSPKQNK